MDNRDKEAQLAHFNHILTQYTDMVVLSITSISADTRQMAQEVANQYGRHLWDDLVLLVMGEPSGESDKETKDFQMWADELK